MKRLVLLTGRQAGMLEAGTTLLKDKLDVLKQKETTECNIEVVHRKLADAKDEANSLVDGLRRGTSRSIVKILHNVDQMSIAVSSRLRGLIDREAQEFQQSHHAALRNAEDDVRESFVGAPKVVNKTRNVIVGHEN